MRSIFDLPLTTVALALLVIVFAGCGSREPVHEGTPLSQWLKQLKSTDEGSRKDAAKALGRFGPKDPQVVPELTAALADDSAAVRAAAAESLGQCGDKAESALQPLIKALRDKDRTVRANAALALGRIDVEGRAAVKPLMEALKDPDLEVRRIAAVALGNIGPPAKEAVPALIEAIKKDQDAYFRENANDAITKIDPK